MRTYRPPLPSYLSLCFCFNIIYWLCYSLSYTTTNSSSHKTFPCWSISLICLTQNPDFNRFISSYPNRRIHSFSYKRRTKSFANTSSKPFFLRNSIYTMPYILIFLISIQIMLYLHLNLYSINRMQCSTRN